MEVEDDQPCDSEARSAFGTKAYWDDVYAGRGDFPADEYSWYYGYEILAKHMKEHVKRRDHLLVPGIGNDPILLDLLKAGYKMITAQDYSEHAIERQNDLLEYCHGYDASRVALHQSDVRQLPASWENRFDAILEKGLLDAVYLSGDGNVERAVDSLSRTLKPGGIFVSVSGVVPDELRSRLFSDDCGNWTWLRDGSADLQAGCFIFRKGV